MVRVSLLFYLAVTAASTAATDSAVVADPKNGIAVSAHPPRGNNSVLNVAEASGISSIVPSKTTFRNRILNETGDEHHHDEEDHDNDNKKKWGEVIGLTLLVNLATLSGVLFFIPVLSRKSRAWVKSICWSDAVPSPVLAKPEDSSARTLHLLDLIIPAFASGALIATAVFLVIPEAIMLINVSLAAEHDEHDEHVRMLFNETIEEEEEHTDEISPDAIWRFGASLLGGFLLPLLIEAIAATFRHKDGDDCKDPNNDFHDDIEGAAKIDRTTEGAAIKRAVNWGLVTTILVGDAFHNFCDGIFIGVALSLCDRTTAYTIMAITLYHEIAQELADYFLLTKHAGLRPLHALSLNFCSGLSVVLGGIAVLIAPISDLLIGVLLSVAAGVYIYIAACECMPRVQAVVQTTQDRIITIMLFIIGCIPIGLALLNHSHCEAESHDEH